MIYVDPPEWPGHGRLWSHLISDESFEELHAFAERVGLPRQAFERDHYDVIAERYPSVIEAGAEPVSTRRIVELLQQSGLRRRKGTSMFEVSPAGRRWPEPLRPGSVVAVIAPAGPLRAERLQRGVDLLRAWDLEPRLGPNTATVHDQLSYLSAGDKERAEELTAAWSDPEVAAVWAGRGGYGTQRMIDLIDFDALRAAGPKHFLGFSDITALHARIGRELDQITLHSPAVAAAVAQLDDQPSVDQLRRMIFERPEAGAELGSGTTLVPGTGRGRLIGGNLSLVASGIGVDPVPDRPSILFLEDVDEEGYRVDRMLTHLARSGWLAEITGVVIGQFTETDNEAQLLQVFADRLGGLGVPVITGVEAGHAARNLTLPLGAEVTLTAEPDRASLALADHGATG